MANPQKELEKESEQLSFTNGAEASGLEILKAIRNGVPLLDVRAPVEFKEGSLPGAVNLPILNDEERHLIGTCYKQNGQDAAIALGMKLVSGEVKQSRIEGWKKFLGENPNALLYCFRGGLRSKTAQTWLAEAGISVPRVEGGYKKTRQELIKILSDKPQAFRFFIITGTTGCGKTRVLHQLVKSAQANAAAPANLLDLEALANHKGSAFGREIDPQPSQIDFENALALQFMRWEGREQLPLFAEDESRMIGKRVQVDSVYLPLRVGPLLVIEESTESRTTLILEEYLQAPYQERIKRSGKPDQALQDLRAFHLESVKMISKGLGGLRAQQLTTLMNQAFDLTQAKGDWEAHHTWISFVLREYYDPFYLKHLEKEKERIVFKGSRAELFNWIQSNPPENFMRMYECGDFSKVRKLVPHSVLTE